ncbi:MAG: phosphatidylinositol-3-phosphatase [Thermoleophilaceae bacterium]|nr:phosphatidylinositol-3-phosphatase [Thermoleophilaceae bacterium]
MVASSTVAFAIALIVAAPGSGQAPLRPAKARVNRIAVLVLENRSSNQIIGNPSAPYLNSLARRGALATHYYAITHPSLPNYLALTTGGHQNVNRDCTSCRSRGQSLANQLETAKISWRAYFESIQNPLTTTFSRGSAYDPHYNPFAYTAALRAPDPVGDVGTFAALHHDLATRALPRFAWIAPNVWHDGHNVKLATVDRFARQLVPRIVAALGPRGVLFVTWDEGQNSDTQGAHGLGGGHVPLIALGPAARMGARISLPSNHYALLRTIESTLGLPRLGHARDATVPSLDGLLRA